MGWRDKGGKKDKHKDINRDIEYDKNVDIDVDVNVKQSHETNVTVNKDIDKDIDVDVNVDLDGNHFELDGHTQVVQSKEGGVKWHVDSYNVGSALDSTDTSTVGTQTFLYTKDDPALLSTLKADGTADGKHSYAELAYTFNFDEKGFTEIIVHMEGHGLHGGGHG